MDSSAYGRTPPAGFEQQTTSPHSQTAWAKLALDVPSASVISGGVTGSSPVQHCRYFKLFSGSSFHRPAYSYWCVLFLADELLGIPCYLYGPCAALICLVAIVAPPVDSIL